MAMERVPYLVGGGFEHSAEVMRAALAAATSGAEGILTPGDFKVTPTSVPGTNIAVAPGNGLIRNSYGGGGAQTYAVRAPSQTQLPIQATGSAGARTDLVVARVDDPTYAGGPFDPGTFEAAKFEVIRGVPAVTTSAAELGLSYPAIALARITLPKSTGTVTAGMVRDLRKIAQPRKERHIFVRPMVQGDGVRRLANEDPTGQYWPDVTSWRVEVPVWAQRVRMVAQWGGVSLLADGKNSYGRLWVQLGSVSDPAAASSQETSWDIPSNLAGNVREAWMGGDDRAVPVGLRGREIPVGLRGRVRGADTAASKPQLDSVSVVSLDLEFYETAV